MTAKVALLALLACAGVAAAQVEWVSTRVIPGDAEDVSGNAPGANGNRLGGLGSSVFYDADEDVLYALPDRGAGGGVYSYNSRYHTFKISMNTRTGALRRTPTITSTTFLKRGDLHFNGISPHRPPNADGTTLGMALDPEGLVPLSNGNLLISDEYGPSVIEFSREGQFVRAFEPPANIIPRFRNGTNWFADDGTAAHLGRQPNRGYEGLAVDPFEEYAYGVLQDPLQEEGTPSSNPGRLSRNVRLIRYNLATGKSDAQFVYQLESLADINARLPVNQTFPANQQGRVLVLCEIVALTPETFLVLERDSRGLGTFDPISKGPAVGSKRVFFINITGATDVSAISLVNFTTTLPPGVTPVSKSLLLDIDAELKKNGETVVEKYEGLTLGPQLDNGDFSLILVNDNDFSTSQLDQGEQFDVYTNYVDTFEDLVPLDTPPKNATLSLIPTFFNTFRVPKDTFVVTPKVRFVKGFAKVCTKGKPSIKFTLKRRGSLAAMEATVRATVPETAAVSLASEVTVSFAEGEDEAAAFIPVRQTRRGRRSKAQRKEAAATLQIVSAEAGSLRAVVDPMRGQMQMVLRGDC